MSDREGGEGMVGEFLFPVEAVYGAPGAFFVESGDYLLHIHIVELRNVGHFE